jgi:hypothetical protein
MTPKAQLVRVASRYRALRAAGLCRTCRASSPDRARCASCRAEEKAAVARRNEIRARQFAAWCGRDASAADQLADEVLP